MPIKFYISSLKPDVDLQVEQSGRTKFAKEKKLI